MTTICVGCGLDVDAQGRVALDLASIGMDMASSASQAFPHISTAAAGSYTGIDLSIDLTNSSDCVDKSLFVGCTSDLANVSIAGQNIEHKIEVSIGGGAFITLVQAEWNLAWNGSWQEVVIPTGGWATVAPGASINVRFRTTFRTYNAGDGTTLLNVAQGSCFGMLAHRSS